MSEKTRRRDLARFLQRTPWVVKAAYPFYQLTRARFTVGVVGVVFDRTGRVLLAEHVYHPLVPWGIPGGGVGRGEDPSNALMREFVEELAMQVKVDQPLAVERTFFGHVDIAFLCHSSSEPVVSSTELLSVGWFPRDALPPVTKFQYKALSRAYALVDPQSEILAT